MIKRLIGTVLDKLGYVITRKDRGGFYSSYLAKICAPKTVFDVGVGPGTPELYDAYPGARFYLVEPLEEFKAVLKRLAGEIDCVLCRKAVSDEKGAAEITIEHDPQMASFCERPRVDSPAGKRQVEVTTLDDIFAENPGITLPILIKIDVEGFELKVLKGARKLLKSTEMVIVETSVAKRFENGSSLEEVISFMSENGFAVFDFLTVLRREGVAGAHFVDVAFKKK